ncbi:zinc finger protein 185 [Dromiciops gliroides]|uniref:zinc finger protein 185 n=1 Tax=Dromiciops gliroides TaxID=33562 RepID=UPI001CC59E18|nr:zinc finger protein 185 [Dromiciops gliroides]
MMPFGKNPKGHSQSGEDDRKNVIKQMKVRANIKSDKSWIHKPDDTQGQTIELPPSGEHYSMAPPLITTRKDRPPAPKPSSGYIIRGVFTKPIDSTPLPQTHCPVTFETPKRSTVPGKPVTASLSRPSASGYKMPADDCSKKMVEIMEDEVPPERSQSLLPSLGRQLYSFTSGKREESHTLPGHDPKLESTLLEVSPEANRKRAFSKYKERNISSTRGDIVKEAEDKERYTDADRSSTWSTDSNQGSTGSQNDVDEIEVTSKKGSTVSFDDRHISSTHGGGYEGPSKQQAAEPNKPSRSEPHSREGGIREMPLVPPVPREYRLPYWNLIRLSSEECGALSPDDQYDHSMNLQYSIPSENTTKYASASTVTTTEERYGSSASLDDPIPSENRRFASSSVSSTDQRFGTLPSVDNMMTSEHRSSLSGYEERSVTTIVREARWDSTGPAGAKGSTRPDPKIHYSSDYRVNTPDSTHQLPLKGSGQESSSRRCVPISGEKTSASSKAASLRDSASSSGSEGSSNPAKISGVICTYCCNEIRSGPKITLEHLGICCHEGCFKCGICKRKMGTMLDHVYIHKGIIHCDQCYARLF